MKNENKQASVLFPIAISLGLLFVTMVAFFFSVSASGSASLPNGTIATINGPFSCSENSETTVIEAGGHVFSFSPNSISVDEKIVAPLDSDVTDVVIDASHGTASLRINGDNVPISR